MKITKRLLAIILAIATVMSIPVYAKSQTFSDVKKNHWAFDYIDTLVEKKVVNGYEDGTFLPNKSVTRAEWAKMLSITAEIPTYSNYKDVIKFCAEDVKSDDWSAPYLVSALPFFPFGGTESPSGKISVKFRPKKSATRLEITKSIVLEKGYSLKKPNYNLVTNFIDYLDIPEDDMAYVAVAVEHGIIKGMDDGSFKPNKSVTRAEAATILYRAYIGEKELTETKKPYIMSTLVDAKIDSMFMATLDSLGNLYYIDKTDNKVYKMSMRDRKKVEYYDFSNLSYTKDDVSYSKYVPVQLFWDNATSTLLLNGYFQNCEKPAETPITNGTYNYCFDITDINDVNMYFWYNDGSKYRTIHAIVNNDYMIYNYGSSNGGKSGEMYKWRFGGGSDMRLYYTSYGYKNVSVSQVGNDIYFFRNGESQPYINIYDFTEGNLRTVTDSLVTDASGFKGDYFYYVDSYKEVMYKLNFKTLKVEDLNIKFDDAHIDFSDLTNMEKTDDSMLVINDYTYIFYDYDMKSFRILEKNVTDTSDTVREYDEDFYTFYDSYLPN